MNYLWKCFDGFMRQLPPTTTAKDRINLPYISHTVLITSMRQVEVDERQQWRQIVTMRPSLGSRTVKGKTRQYPTRSSAIAEGPRDASCHTPILWIQRRSISGLLANATDTLHDIIIRCHPCAKEQAKASFIGKLGCCTCAP